MDNMEEGKVYEKKITKEQYLQLIAIKKQQTWKDFLTGVHSAMIAFALNLILYMAQQVYVPDSPGLGIIGCVAVGIFTLRRMSKILEEHRIEASDKMKNVIFTQQS